MRKIRHLKFRDVVTLNVGDMFWFGKYHINSTVNFLIGLPDPGKLVWRIIEKTDDHIFALSYHLVDYASFSKGKDRKWEVSEARKWLNEEFYENAFSEEEKNLIKTVKKDKVTLLTKKEAETLISVNDKKRGVDWWLRSAGSTFYDRDIAVVNKYGYTDSTMMSSACGIRPAIYIDLKTAERYGSDEEINTDDYDVENGVLYGVSKNLSEAFIPGEVNKIGVVAFNGCSLLTRVVLPDGLKTLHPSMFFYCKNMKSVCFKGLEIELSDLKDPDRDLDTILNMLITNDFTVECDKYLKYRYLTDYFLISGNSEAKEYIKSEFPKMVNTFIKADDAERICSLVKTDQFIEKKNVNKLLTTVFEKKYFDVVPMLLEYKDKLDKFKYDETEKYLKYASGNEEITALVLDYRNKYFSDEQLEEIRTEIFEKKTGLAEMTEKDWKAIFSCKTVGGNITISKYKGDDTVVTVPDMIGNKPVTAIGTYAFSPDKRGTKADDKERFKKITSVHLGKNITEICDHAFSGCSALIEINTPESLNTIGKCAFYGCSSLKEYIFPEKLDIVEFRVLSACTSIEEVRIPEGVTEIGENAFEGNTGMKKIELNSGLKRIKSYAFRYCSALAEIAIPDGTEHLGYSVFDGCKVLKDISLPKSITSIYNGALKNNAWITEQLKKHPVVVVNGIVVEGSKDSDEVVIPDGVTVITGNAFEKCRIKNVVFPESLKVIENFAFYNCSGLSEIRLPAGISEVGKYAFNGCTGIHSIMKGNEEVKLSEFAIR